MATKLIPEELDALIQEYLTDGVLTDKERQVILKKAEGMGLDRDEIDLYLDAQVQKIDQATDAAVRKQKGKSCPYCGASVPLLTDKCPECGQHITPEASKELDEILNNLEDALVNIKSGYNIKQNKAVVERYARKAKLYYSNNPKIQRLLDEIKEDSYKATKSAKRRARIDSIKDFCKNHKILTFFIGYILISLILSPIIITYNKVSENMDKQHAQEISNKVTNLISEGKIDEAKYLLKNDDIAWGTKDQYDVLYMSVAKAYVDKGELDAAEEIGLTLRAKLDSWKWNDSSTRKYLIGVFKQAERDYSMLKTDKDDE